MDVACEGASKKTVRSNLALGERQKTPGEFRLLSLEQQCWGSLICVNQIARRIGRADLERTRRHIDGLDIELRSEERA